MWQPWLGAPERKTRALHDYRSVGRKRFLPTWFVIQYSVPQPLKTHIFFEMLFTFIRTKQWWLPVDSDRQFPPIFFGSSRPMENEAKTRRQQELTILLWPGLPVSCLASLWRPLMEKRMATLNQIESNTKWLHQMAIFHFKTILI